MIIDNIPHLGYFVEGLSDDGSIGPAPHIHPGGSTAFSYARDIRFHLYYLYVVSAKLSQSINTIARPNKSKIAHQIPNDHAKLETTLQKIAELPMVVFIDEIQKDFPLVTIGNSQGVTKLSAELKKTSPWTPHCPVSYLICYSLQR